MSEEESVLVVEALEVERNKASTAALCLILSILIVYYFNFFYKNEVNFR